jgi:hypothetical protein
LVVGTVVFVVTVVVVVVVVFVVYLVVVVVVVVVVSIICLFVLCYFIVLFVLLFICFVLLLITFSCKRIFLMLPSPSLMNYNGMPTICSENITSAAICEIDCDVRDRWRLECLATLRMHAFADWNDYVGL